MIRPLRSLSLLMATALVVAGCGAAATTAPSPTTPPTPAPTEAAASAAPTPSPTVAPSAAAGSAVLAVPAVGFEMTLADGWLVLPLDRGADAIRALLPADSQLMGSLASGLQPLLEAGLAGWAIDGSAGEGTITPNVNLLVREGIELPALDEMVAAVTSELEAVTAISAVESRAVEVAGSPAVRSTYLGLGEGEAARAQGVQYTIPSVGGRLLIVSFTIPANDPGLLAAVEEMAAAIELAP